MPADQRDRLIVALRRKGWTLRKIAHHLNMSKSGVASSLQRIAEGRPGNDPRA
jgi:lambda repressor-like predicted transcriptional regulator